MFSTIKSIITLNKTIKVCKKINETLHLPLNSDKDIDNLMAEFAQINTLMQENEALLDKNTQEVQGKKNKKIAPILNGAALSVCVETMGAMLFLTGDWNKFNELHGYYAQKLSSVFLKLNISDLQMEKVSKLMETLAQQREKGQKMVHLRQTLTQLEQEPNNEELKVEMEQLKAYFYNAKGFTKTEFTAEKILVELYLGNPERAQQEALVLLDSKEKDKRQVHYEVNINSGISHLDIGKKFFAILDNLLDMEPSAPNKHKLKS